MFWPTMEKLLNIEQNSFKSKLKSIWEFKGAPNTISKTSMSKI